ncbi:filamentous hemagglutinin N-terminal domain-containing protein [Thermopetrobacter sp. TC1]|uniref:filamentous hemagglutinin N-terminal domain-containing protein n=1 Tax=Thermopetrobacter sp. TC1 TaxID=1495045 RepID=UPI00056EBE09|nr:filamentous hemagglutinin N-terminal domain-containing protein [Thermopetrobacter sp. TC1]
MLACAQAWAGSDAPVSAADNRTKVTTGQNGRTTVQIAPVEKGGLSHNRYIRFDVPAAGVDLDNRQRKARIILNEVVSTRRSRLNGPLSVLGQKAHVIIANPNGITVDGASFHNIGGLVLATGAWSRSKNRLTISGGDIHVTGQGLAARMSQVHLLSHKLRINAPITAGEHRNLVLEAGTGSAKVNEQIPIDKPEGLITFTADGRNGDTYLVTIEQGAHLNGGAIRIAVNARGAGVRLSGDVISSQGAITISGDGDVDINDAHVKARDHVRITGRAVSLRSLSRQSEIESTQSGIKIDASGNITSTGVIYRAARRATADFDAPGAISMRADRGISISAGSGFISRMTTNEHGIDLSAQESIDIDDTEIDSKGRIHVGAGEGLSLTNGTMQSTANIHLLSESGTISAIGQEIVADDSVFLSASALKVRSNTVRRSLLEARLGGVLGTFTGDVINDGGLIQGTIRIRGSDQSQGGVTIITDGKLINRTLAVDRIGSIYSQKEALYISAKAGIENLSGRLLSEADITLETENGVLNDARRESFRIKRKTKGLPRLLGSNKKTYFYGNLLVGKEIGQIKAAGDLHIQAKTMRNVGSEIAAGNVNLDIAETAQNISIALGKTTIKRRCFLMFCTYRGSSHITTETASIFATGKITIKAGKSWYDYGGSLTATQGIEISSRSIHFEPLYWKEFYARPSGISGLFIGHWGRLFTNYQGSLLNTNKGEIRLITEGETIVLDAVDVDEKVLRTIGGPVSLTAKPKGLRRKNAIRIDFWPFNTF